MTLSSPAPAKLSASRHARREKIVATGLALIQERGFENVQIREVSEISGLALATVYRYFPSKDYLLACVLEQWCEGYYEALGRAPKARTNARRLAELCRRSVEAFENEPQFTILAASLQTSADPAVAESLARVRCRSVDFFVTVLDGIAEADKRSIVEIVFAVMTEKLLLWRTGRIGIDDVYRDVEKCAELLLVFKDPRAT